MTNRNDLSKPVKDFVIPVKTLVRMDQTVDEALATLRKQPIDEKIIYFYVVDKNLKLKGVISTRNLLLNAPHTPVKEIMEKSIFRVHSDQTLDEALEILSKHHLLAIPVVDEEENLMGIIDVQIYLEEAIDIAQSKLRSDLFQMLGLTIEEGKKKSVWQSFRIRMPWLFCNMIGGTACAIISRVFELVLAKVLLLAFFIPLVLTLSESISMQSMTNSLQFLHRSRISWTRIFYRVLLEWRMVVLIAIACGVTVGLISLLWGEGIPPAIVIMVGIAISVSVSACIGAAIPLILHAKKLDPKVAAGPVVLTLADVITTAIYLSLATWWLL